MEHPADGLGPFVSPRDAAGPQPATELPLRRAPSSIPESSYRSSAGDLLDNFTLTCEPALRLKLKKRLLGCRFGAHLTVEHPSAQTGRPDRSWELTVRPPLGAHPALGQLCSKLSLLPERRQVRWRTAKVTLLRFFRIKLFAGYDWGLRQGGWRYSVHTKWNADQHKTATRVRVPLSSRAEVIPHLAADYSLPSMEGGSGGGDELQTGFCHLSLPKLDLQLSLDRRVPGRAPVWAGWPLLRRRRRRREAAALAAVGAGEAEWQLSEQQRGAAAKQQASSGAAARPAWELPQLQLPQLPQLQLPHLQLPAWRLPERISLPWAQPGQQASGQQRR